MARNLSLNLISVPSRKNLADTPSRSMSHLDCSLSPSAWHQVDSAFGPHTIDLMALPFNVQVDRASRPLRFFSLFPCARQIRIQMFFPVRSHWFAFEVSQLLRMQLFLLWSLICAPGSFGGHWFQGTPHVPSSLALKGIPTFYCSPSDLAPLCGNHALYSGIFG